MRALTVFVALAAVAANLAEALPWLDRHPLAVLALVFGLIYLVGRRLIHGHPPPPKANLPIGIDACDGYDGCNEGGDGGGDGGC